MLVVMYPMIDAFFTAIFAVFQSDCDKNRQKTNRVYMRNCTIRTNLLVFVERLEYYKMDWTSSVVLRNRSPHFATNKIQQLDTSRFLLFARDVPDVLEVDLRQQGADDP